MFGLKINFEVSNKPSWFLYFFVYRALCALGLREFKIRISKQTFKGDFYFLICRSLSIDYQTKKVYFGVNINYRLQKKPRPTESSGRAGGLLGFPSCGVCFFVGRAVAG